MLFNFSIYNYNNFVINLKGKFLLTLNGEMKEKFKEFYIMDNKVAHTINGWEDRSNNTTEIIITNYLIYNSITIQISQNITSIISQLESRGFSHTFIGTLFLYFTL